MLSYLVTNSIEYSSLIFVSAIMRLMTPGMNVMTSLAISGKRLKQSASAPWVIAPVIRDIQGCTTSITMISAADKALENAGSVLTRLNPPERFAEPEVSDDIKTHKGETQNDVNTLLTLFSNFVDELIHTL